MVRLLRIPAACALFWVLMCSSGLVSAQVYTWVDEKGKVHYSDKKPPDSEKRQVQQVDDAVLNNANTFESIDDGVDVDQLARDRKRRESEDEALAEKALKTQAEEFISKNCYDDEEGVRRGKAGGGTRIVDTKQVKRCRIPIPASLQPFMADYSYQEGN